MSESIKITVIVEDENKSRKEVNVTHDINMTLMSTLLKRGLISGNFCGGRGVCQRCRVQFMGAAPVPSVMERKAFSPEELRKGYRLACLAKPHDDCVVRLDIIKDREIDIVTDTPKRAVADKLTEAVNESYALTSVGQCLIAVDLGTTTIAMQLMEMESGRVIDTYLAMNPQRTYGADVLSRIKAANDGYAEVMKDSVWKVIYDGVSKFRQIKVKEQPISISCMCIAGNTTMEHLLMGLSTEGLGKSPFTPVELGLQKCTISEYELPVYITPAIGAFVGGDIVAGLYHCDLLRAKLTEASKVTEDSKVTEVSVLPESKSDGAFLFIDLGTNGEMAIVDEERIIVTATAAGPAFEGGAGETVIGSDMIKFTASLLEQGIIDETGLLIKEEAAQLKQNDIRALQMAKAAVRAGVDILCKKICDSKVTRVYLAGGFGYYLNIDSAVAIGLLPESLRDCTTSVGNTSLAGAFDMGKDLWSGRLKEDALHRELKQIESINLAREEDFESLYISYLNFPKPFK